MLENEQRLHFDWNSTTFFVTDLAFSESVGKYEITFWQQICKTEIERLHFDIESTFMQRFP